MLKILSATGVANWAFGAPLAVRRTTGTGAHHGAEPANWWLWDIVRQKSEPRVSPNQKQLVTSSAIRYLENKQHATLCAEETNPNVAARCVRRCG